MPNGAKLSPSREMEDALMYLPRKGVTDHRKGWFGYYTASS